MHIILATVIFFAIAIMETFDIGCLGKTFLFSLDPELREGLMAKWSGFRILDCPDFCVSKNGLSLLPQV
jgi:hypothetical protein